MTEPVTCYEIFSDRYERDDVHTVGNIPEIVYVGYDEGVESLVYDYAHKRHWQAETLPDHYDDPSGWLEPVGSDAYANVVVRAATWDGVSYDDSGDEVLLLGEIVGRFAWKAAA